MEQSSGEPQTYCPSDSITQHTLLRTQHLNQIYRCIFVTSNFQSLLITGFSSVYIVCMYVCCTHKTFVEEHNIAKKPPIMLQNSKDSPNLKLGLRQDFILILINKPINYLHYGKKLIF